MMALLLLSFRMSLLNSAMIVHTYIRRVHEECCYKAVSFHLGTLSSSTRTKTWQKQKRRSSSSSSFDVQLSGSEWVRVCVQIFPPLSLSVCIKLYVSLSFRFSRRNVLLVNYDGSEILSLSPKGLAFGTDMAWVSEWAGRLGLAQTQARFLPSIFSPGYIFMKEDI